MAIIKFIDPVTGEEKTIGGGTSIPITDDPADNVNIWIDPNDEGSPSNLTIEDIGLTTAPMYTYGTEDLVAGFTPLQTGKLYFVYE